LQNNERLDGLKERRGSQRFGSGLDQIQSGQWMRIQEGKTIKNKIENSQEISCLRLKV
jgi:hypothetical protein